MGEFTKSTVLPHLLHEKKIRKYLLPVLLILALAAFLSTTAILSKNAETMTKKGMVLDCHYHIQTGEGYAGYVVHVHNEDCYDAAGNLVCELPEIPGHVHDESCWGTENVLSCGLEESDGHVHEESCYGLVRGNLVCGLEETSHAHNESCYSVVRGELVCGLEESEDHQHTDDCYLWTEELTCGLEETEGHVHTDDCYEWVEGLVCGLEECEEHHHSESCYETVREPVCGQQGLHTHTPACYDETGALICGQLQLEEHIHGPGCFVVQETDEESDPNADVESYWDYAARFAYMDKTGPWNELLVEVAKTQLGYTESTRNFVIENGEHKGYTRYGAWYGLPYGDWCAMFVSFCLNFAEVPTDAMPIECGVTRWIDALMEKDLYTGAEGYTPKMGDIIFFDYDQDEKGDHVGIVTSVNVAEGTLVTIEGNHNPAVGQFTYALSDPAILGYGILPERPTEEKSESEPAGEDTTLALITAADGSPLPENVTIYAYELSGEDAESARQEVENYLAGPVLPGPMRTMRLQAAQPAAIGTETSSETRYEVFEIGLDNMEEAAFEGGFRVSVTLPTALTGRDFALYHLGGAGVETLEAEYESVLNEDGTETVTGFRFVTDSFSPFVLRYTVDFHYTGEDGESYDFSMPGGGYITLGDLVQALHLAEDYPETEANEHQNFINSVESVSFSDPTLIWVGRTGEETTVGALAAAEGLNIAYSEELTGDEIAALRNASIPVGEWLLVSLHPFESEETLTITLTDGTVYSVAVTDARLVGHYLSDSGELYEVAVIYGEDAQIPEGAALKIREFADGTEEYQNARNAVLADILSRGETVDLSTFGLAALDISILNAEGIEIEPAAPVQVEMSIKELPGVEDLNEITDTLAIQHHVEVENGVVVETVFGGDREAFFRLETDETVAASGTAVDPNSVSDEDFARNEPSDWDSNEGSESDDVNVSFPTDVFSTFTVTWGNSSSSALNVNGTIVRRLTELENGAEYIVAAHVVDGNSHTYYALNSNTSATRITELDNTTYERGTTVTLSGVPSGAIWRWGYVNGSGDSMTGTLRNVSTNQYLRLGNNLFGNDSRNLTFSRETWNNYNHIRIKRTDNDYYLQYNYGFFGRGYNGSYLVFIKVDSSAAAPSDAPHTTIHYGYMNGNTFVEFEEQPSPASVSTSHHAYLIYDFDGYQYAGKTYYRTTEAVDGVNMTTGATSIQARLRYSDSRWQYRSNSWNNVADGSHIYVVYDKKPDDTLGGTPTPKQVAGVEPPAPPTITKSSTVNGDGTNTLSLSVSGHTADLEVEKLADVIVVFDISGSMSTTDMSRASRLEAGRDAINNLADVLLSKTNSYGDKLIRMGLVTFSTDARVAQGLTDDKNVFKAAVNKQTTPSGGTNWEKALMLANQMEVDSGRATFVIFVTDGDPTFRVSRMDETDATLDMYGKNGSDDYYVSNDVFGEGNDDSLSNNYNAAKEAAESIIAHKKTFYTIAISSDATKLNNFADDVGAAGKYTATSSAQLSQAFDDIAASIIALMGHSDIQISDGITDLTQTVQKSPLINYPEDDFTYYKGHAATEEDVAANLADSVGEMVWEAWDPASENCTEAVYNSATGAVEWNMGTNFMPRDGYTYQVRFKVWPSQEAYDLLADLNNGKKTYDSLTDEEKAQISEPASGDGVYTLKTNSETSYTYREATKSGDTITPTGEPSVPGRFPDVDPLELTTKPLMVKKQWHNNYSASREPIDSITMQLYGVDSDGVTSHDFKTITLTADEGWYSENNYISYGLVTYNTYTNSGEKIYETGHDFTLREIDDEAHYYELTAGVFRAMYINGTPTILERMDVAPAGMGSDVFHYSDGEHDYYRLDGKIYRNTKSDVLLIATNSRRSYMDLNKVVVDESGVAAVDDTEFEYKVTFTVPDGIANYDTVEKYIWFSVYDSAAHRTLSPDEYTYANAQKPADVDSAYSDPAYANYLVVTSGQQLTLKIKQGWNVRFLNLPIGTTYSFEEVSIPTGYDFVSAEVSGSRWIANMVDGVDQGEAQEMSALPSNSSGSNSNTGITGTIEYANARYKTTYTNKTITTPVMILKTAQDGTKPLPGAVFSLYTEHGYNADPKVASKTDLVSDEYGIIDLGKLSYGKYYLVETTAPDGYIALSAPVEITVAESGVTYNQNDSSLSMSNNGIHYDTETKAYTLTVTNNAGVVLPSTGGPGIGWIRLLGLVLTVASCTVLILRRKRKAV